MSLLEKLLNMPSNVLTTSTTSSDGVGVGDIGDYHDQGGDGDNDDNDDSNDDSRKITPHKVVLFTDHIISPIDHHCLSSLTTEHPHITIITCNSNMLLLCMSTNDDDDDDDSSEVMKRVINNTHGNGGDDKDGNGGDDKDHKDKSCSIWPSKQSKQVRRKG